MVYTAAEYRNMMGVKAVYQPKGNKYHAKKVRTIYGMFDSQHEADEFAKLTLLLNTGAISNLRRQVRYEIIPQQTEEYEVKLKTKTKVCTRVVERAAHYTADFVYWDNINKREVVCDAKSKATRELKDYQLRKKLMLHVHGIKIKEM